MPNYNNNGIFLYYYYNTLKLKFEKLFCHGMDVYGRVWTIVTFSKMRAEILLKNGTQIAVVEFIWIILLSIPTLGDFLFAAADHRRFFSKNGFLFDNDFLNGIIRGDVVHQVAHQILQDHP